MSDFLVPDLGEGLEDATVTSWSVAVGDTVELNQTLCTLETAKAQVEIPSPYAGRVAALGGAEGDVLAVGAMLVQIDTVAAAEPSEPSGHSEPGTPKTIGCRRATAPAHEIPCSSAMGPTPRSTPADDGPGLSRRCAGLPRNCGWTSRTRPPGQVEWCPENPYSRRPRRPGAGEVTEVRGVRAEMAKRMTLSRSQIPDAHASVDVDCVRLLEVHERLSVSAFALTLRLTVLALTHHRLLNATWVDAHDGPQVHAHPVVHLGVAVAAPAACWSPWSATPTDSPRGSWPTKCRGWSRAHARAR